MGATERTGQSAHRVLILMSLDGSSSKRLKVYCAAWLEFDETELCAECIAWGGGVHVSWGCRVRGM